MVLSRVAAARDSRQRGTSAIGAGVWEGIMRNDTCSCGTMLETHVERESGRCEGCLIDGWEREQAQREQRWLEDDRNWPEGANSGE